MQEKRCQVCDMPMGTTDELYGTEANGSKNSDYCKHCYENGVLASNCQSCAMPMGTTDEMYGTEANGSKSSDYCKHCYENGAFTSKSITMDEMIENCVPHIANAESGMNEDEARKMMKEFLPTLKRWN